MVIRSYELVSYYSQMRSSQRKKTIGIFYCVGLILWLVSLMLFIQLLTTGHPQLNLSQLLVEIVIGWIGGILIVISLSSLLNRTWHLRRHCDIVSLSYRYMFYFNISLY